MEVREASEQLRADARSVVGREDAVAGPDARRCGGDAPSSTTMRANASSQVARRKSSVRRSRTSGCRRRAGLSMISRDASPRTHRKPWLSGFSSSPLTATSLPSRDLGQHAAQRRMAVHRAHRADGLHGRRGLR